MTRKNKSAAAFIPLEKLRAREQSSLAGFTFVELMLVAVIIASLAGLAVPRLRAALAKYELENFVKNTYYLSFYLQSSAVSQEKIYCLELDPPAGLIRPVYKEGSSFRSVSGRFGRISKAPANIRLYAQKKTICFYPDASTDQGRIDFENTQIDKMSVVFEGVNGAIQIQ
jgi:Tfp pilus assembly protein FimT